MSVEIFNARPTDVKSRSLKKSLEPRRPFPFLSLFVGLIVGFSVTLVEARPWSVDRFYGTFEGASDTAVEGELSKRGLRVIVRPDDTGFIVDWSAQMTKLNGRVKRTEYSIAFEPTHRENIYQSMMRTDLFGHMRH